MNKTLTSLLVGSHFHPPAKVLLQHLPAGAILQLEPDPENPYDANAVRVLLPASSIPEERYTALESPFDGLPCQGATLEQIMSTGPHMLGHVAASGGKPLAKWRQQNGGHGFEIVGNMEMLDWIKDPGHRASLGFGPSGEPLVLLRIDEPESQAIPEPSAYQESQDER